MLLSFRMVDGKRYSRIFVKYRPGDQIFKGCNYYTFAKINSKKISKLISISTFKT